ncbi:DUF4406 domain-containing protein [Pectinatus frisingensis]|uniref:DUF7768 domain-containing protein n=1 Tax=Pectinatus frisingensis TaxID=865 RepID=UPI003D8031AC
MDKIFICSPYRDNIQTNTEIALKAAKAVMKLGYIPIVPHLYFTRFLDEDNQKERDLGIASGIDWMQSCKEIWIIGNRITEGMKLELQAAQNLKLPIKKCLLKNDGIKMISALTITEKISMADYVNNVYKF